MSESIPIVNSSSSVIIERHYQEELTSFSPSTLDNWVPDDEAPHCYRCRSDFSLLKRRHHCRLCGRIFCYNCSKESRKIPRLFQRLLPVLSRKLDMKALHRVCIECCKKVDTIDEETDNLVMELERHMDLTKIRHLHQMTGIQKKAASICLSYIRKVLHYLPDHVFTELDQIVLLTNREKFAGHNRWVVRFIKGLEKGVTESEHLNEHFNELIKSSLRTCVRRATCLELCCGPRCGTLDLDDCLEILPTPLVMVHKAFVQILNKMPLEDLIRWLPMIVPYSIYPIVREYLQTRLEHSEFGFALYALLKLDHLPHEPEMEWLISLLPAKLEKAWSTSLDWFKRIEDELPADFYLPFGQPNPRGWQVKREDIKILKSISTPVIIPFVQGKHTKLLLYKKQDVRKDWLAMVCIHWMNQILNDHGLKIVMKTYGVLPLTHTSGLIEIVSGDTIASLSEKWSIQNYILEHNRSLKVDDIRRIYIEGTAAYTVFSYVLGLGDRHPDNVMIDHQGNLFHIDYDYILGDDPKPTLAPSVRISTLMIDAMGGMESLYFKDFLNTALEIYLVLREHVNGLFQILLQLTKLGISPDKISRHIRDRLLVGMQADEARNTFRNVLTASYTSDRGEMVDRMHHYAKESSVISSLSTVTRGISAFWWGK